MCGLVGFGRSEQLQRAMLLQIALQRRDVAHRMRELTRLAGSRRKYGRPYQTNVKTPDGLNGRVASTAFSALASVAWSAFVGLRVSLAGTNRVKTVPKQPAPGKGLLEHVIEMHVPPTS